MNMLARPVYSSPEHVIVIHKRGKAHSATRHGNDTVRWFASEAEAIAYYARNGWTVTLRDTAHGITIYDAIK